MWTKLLPEAGRCNLIFLLEAAGGGQNFYQRLGSSMVPLSHMHSPTPGHSCHTDLRLRHPPSLPAPTSCVRLRRILASAMGTFCYHASLGVQSPQQTPPAHLILVAYLSVRR